MQTEQELKDNFPDIYNAFEEKGYKLTFFKRKSEKLKYICECGIEKEVLYDYFTKNNNCRTCTEAKLKEKPSEKEYTDTITGEIWKPITGGWISDFGNAKSSVCKKLTLCSTKFRYHINSKNQYASRLVAEAFQIENYEKLEDKNYVVSHIDKDPSNNKVGNLKIVTKSDIGHINGSRSRQSDEFKEKINWSQNRFRDIENVKVLELPEHTIYKNGEIWNGSRFLIFSKKDNYCSIRVSEKNYKIHRLICYAFSPIEGKNNFSEYDDLQVNHKDGNTLNNNADNLEWVSSSENMFHSYENNLNKKVRNVSQYSLDNVFIAEYPSIAEASRKTEEPEHRIRTIAQGKTNSLSKYIWKFKNDEETEEYSRKYSKK
jgi:hypothetical protein